MSRITKPFVAVVVAMHLNGAKADPRLLRAFFNDLVEAGHVCRIYARAGNRRVMALVAREIHLFGGLGGRYAAIVQRGRLLPQVAQIGLEPVDALLPLERIAVA